MKSLKLMHPTEHWFTGIVYHPGRATPYTVWHRGETVAFCFNDYVAARRLNEAVAEALVDD